MYSGTGIFMQTGGTNSAGSLWLGYADGYSGTYNLNGGLLSAPTEYIGYGGTATVTQTGGTNAVGNLVLAEGPGLGTYNLGGGLLSLSSLSQGSGTPVFNFSGGTFQATTTFTTYLPIVLTTAGSNGVFDTSGNSLTLSGPLYGPGGLQKIGAGTLTLAVPTSFTGTTLITNGTLLLGDTNSLSGSTFDTSGNGTLNFGGLASANFGGLQGSGNLLLTNSNSGDVDLTVGANNDDTTFSGTLSDTNGMGSLTKVGTGTLVLSGTNTYLGGTTVTDGTMIVTNYEGLADGSDLTVGNPSGSTLGVDPDGLHTEPLSPSIAPVPEPGSLALLAAGAALMAIYRKWR